MLKRLWTKAVAVAVLPPRTEKPSRLARWRLPRDPVQTSSRRVPAHMQVLPDEILTAVLDAFSLHELVPVMTVCRRWNQVVQAHPTYWQHYQIYGIEHAAGNIELRLSRAHDRPVEFDIAWTGVSWTESAASAQRVFNVVAEHLAHTRVLKIVVHHSYAFAMFQLLRRPAPNLEDVSLAITTSAPATWSGATVDAATLPDNILPQATSKLRSLSLMNIVVDDSSIPAFFSSLETLRYHFSRVTIQPPQRADLDIRLHAPAVSNISLTATTSFSQASYHDAGTWSHIKHLSITVLPASIWATLPLESVSRITARVHGACLETFSSHLRGPLSVFINSNGENQCLVRFVDTSGRERVFDSAPHVWLNPNNVLRAVPLGYPPLATRIVSLTAEYDLMRRLTPCFTQQLSSLERLTVILDTKHRTISNTPQANDGSIVCPALREVCLALERSFGGRMLLPQRQGITLLLGLSLRMGSARPAITLDRIEMEDGTAATLDALYNSLDELA